MNPNDRIWVIYNGDKKFPTPHFSLRVAKRRMEHLAKKGFWDDLKIVEFKPVEG